MTVQLSRREIRSVARAGLTRCTPFKVRSGDGDGDSSGDGLTLVGEAAVFNSPTIIDSWEGHFRELLAPGSWKKSLRELTPVLQFDHGSHPVIGSLPIGNLTEASEKDARSVHVEGRLHEDPFFNPVREAIRSGSIRGMSYRFEVIRDVWTDAAGKVLRTNDDIIRALWEAEDADDGEIPTREIKELRVPELGPVVFPQYTDTSVDVRSRRMVIDLGQLDRPEKWSELLRAVTYLAGLAPRQDDEGPPTSAPLPEEHPEETRSEESEAAPPPEEHPAEIVETDKFAEIHARMTARMAQIQQGAFL